MKKLLALLLVILLLPSVCLAEGLGLTIGEYLDKYNAIQAPLESPYRALKKPDSIYFDGEYYHASFLPVADPDIRVTLLSNEYMTEELMRSCRLDCILIFSQDPTDLTALIAIASRCAEQFGSNVLGTNTATMYIGNLIRYYYENNISGDDMSIVTLNEDTGIALMYGNVMQSYAFQIVKMEDYKK